MSKNILIIFILTFIVGCGEKQIEVTPKVEEVKNSRTIKDLKNTEVTDTEFVPAHIANSTIEVVPH
jgi:ABC-type Fe3+-hydroxamate transport system substrate-binding protein